MRYENCKTCGGLVVDGKQKFHHRRRCVGYKQEGVDHIRCKECGYKTASLVVHLKLHGLDTETYRQKYPNAPVCTQAVIDRRAESTIGTRRRTHG